MGTSQRTREAADGGEEILFSVVLCNCATPQLRGVRLKEFMYMTNGEVLPSTLTAIKHMYLYT